MLKFNCKILTNKAFEYGGVSNAAFSFVRVIIGLLS